MTARTRRELADFEWRLTRDHAETVHCPRCDSPPGHPCLNTNNGEELRAPAHWQRIAAANTTEGNP